MESVVEDRHEGDLVEVSDSEGMSFEELTHTLARSLAGFTILYGEDDLDRVALNGYLEWCSKNNLSPVFSVDERSAGIHTFRPIAETVREESFSQEKDEGIDSLSGCPIDGISDEGESRSSFEGVVSSTNIEDFTESVYRGAEGVDLSPSVVGITGRYKVDFEKQWMPFEQSSLNGTVRQLAAKWVGNIRSDSPNSWVISVKGLKVSEYRAPKPTWKDRFMGRSGVQGTLSVDVELSMEITVFNRECPELSGDGDIVEVLSKKLESPPMAMSNTIIVSGEAMSDSLLRIIDVREQDAEN